MKKNSFLDLLDFYKTINHPVLLNLKDGLSIKEINQIQIQNKIELMNCLKDLYSNCNGLNLEQVNEDFEIYFFPNAMLFSLELAVKVLQDQSIYFSLLNMQSLFPILQGEYKSYFLIETNSSSNDYGIIFYNKPDSLEFDQIISYYDSVESMVHSIITCFNEGAYYIENNLVEVDESKEVEINKKLNPNSEYWKLR